MSSSSSFTPLWGMLLMQLPLMLAYLVGIVLALARLQRNPRPATFVLIGCLILFATLLISPLVQAWALQNRGVAQAGQILMAFNFVMAVVRAAGFVLLIIAAFVARPNPDGVYSGFPVGQAAGFDPMGNPAR